MPLSTSQSPLEQDGYGVPARLLGPHTDEFFSVVGRVVTLSALLENRLLVLVERLSRGNQAGLGKIPISALIELGSTQASSVDDDVLRQSAVELFSSAGQTFRLRNDIVHNLWPAQDSGQLFGWRPGRDTSGATLTTNTDIAALKAMILTLTSLIDESMSLWTRLPSQP